MKLFIVDVGERPKIQNTTRSIVVSKLKLAIMLFFVLLLIRGIPLLLPTSNLLLLRSNSSNSSRRATPPFAGDRSFIHASTGEKPVR